MIHIGAQPRLPISDGAGGSLDELVSTLGLITAFAVGVSGLSRKSRGKWAIVGLAFVLAACAVVLPARYLRQKPAKIRIASTATVRIIEPTPGEVVHRPIMNVSVEVVGGRIVQLASNKLRPDQGHLHVSIDGSLRSMTYGQTQKLDINDLAAGEHTFQAEFVALDHGPFAPRVTQTVRFTVA